MICRRCSGPVVHRGRLTTSSYTECEDCGGRNCQVPEDSGLEELEHDDASVDRAIVRNIQEIGPDGEYNDGWDDDLSMYTDDAGGIWL